MTMIADIFGGGSADWARAVAGIRYTYLIELRDAGARGFQLPASEIVPTGVENWAGVRELAGHVLLEHGRRRPRPAPVVAADSRPAADGTTTAAAAARRRVPACRASAAAAAAACCRPLLIVTAAAAAMPVASRLLQLSRRTKAAVSRT